MKTEYIIAGAVLLFLVSRRKVATPMEVAQNTEHNVPNWGANWITNQWAVINQGQLATSGALKPGWHL